MPVLIRAVIAIFLAMAVSLVQAQERDFSGVYVTDNYSANSTYSSQYMMIVQKGATALITVSRLIADTAPASALSTFSHGIGTVSGGVITVPQFHQSQNYCVTHMRYSFSEDGRSVLVEPLSTMPTARGEAAGVNCILGDTVTRTKIF